MKARRSSLSIAVLLGIGLLSAPIVNAGEEGARRHGERSIPTPHEIHQYQQVKFLDEDLWTCRLDYGCVVCKNGTAGALIAEVKANYKRADWNIRTDTQEVRQHCVYPGQEVSACLSANVIIEPDPGTRPDTEGDASSCPPR